jgi:hypothetical protein
MGSNRERWNDRGYRVLAVVALGLLATGTISYHLLEEWSWVDSFYFSVVAVTTVGFGDLTPSSDGSKIFTAFYLLSGISIITAYLNLRLQLRTAERGRDE